MSLMFPSTKLLPFNGRLPLIASAPFVNCHWKSDLFQIEYWRNKKLWIPFETEVSNRLNQLPTTSSRKYFLLRLARVLDTFERSLDRLVQLCDNLGIGTGPPGDGYPSNKRAHVFIYPFMCAVILDRCLWALDAGGHFPSVQWSHPCRRSGVSLQPLDYSKLKPVLESFVVSFGSRGGAVVPQMGEPDAEFSTHLCVQAAVAKGEADMRRVMSNLYFISSDRNEKHIEKLLGIVEKIKPRPPTLISQLNMLYQKASFQDLKHCYLGIIRSIITLVSVDLELLRVQTSKYNVNDLLRAAALPVGTIPGHFVLGERILWKTVMSILGEMPEMPVESLGLQDLALATLPQDALSDDKLSVIATDLLIDHQSEENRDVKSEQKPWPFDGCVLYVSSMTVEVVEEEAHSSNENITRSPQAVFTRPTKKQKVSKHLDGSNLPTTPPGHASAPLGKEDLPSGLHQTSRSHLPFLDEPMDFTHDSDDEEEIIQREVEVLRNSILGKRPRDSAFQSPEDPPVPGLSSAIVADQNPADPPVRPPNSTGKDSASTPLQIPSQVDRGDAFPQDTGETPTSPSNAGGGTNLEGRPPSNEDQSGPQGLGVDQDMGQDTGSGREREVEGAGPEGLGIDQDMGQGGANLEEHGTGKEREVEVAKPRRSGRTRTEPQVFTSHGRGQKVIPSKKKPSKKSGPENAGSGGKKNKIDPKTLTSEEGPDGWLLSWLKGDPKVEALLRDHEWTFKGDEDDPSVHARQNRPLELNRNSKYTEEEFELWATEAEDGSVVYSEMIFCLRWPKKSRETLETFKVLLNRSNLTVENSEPYESDEVRTVLDTEVASWDLEALQENHRRYNLHVVPSCKDDPFGFNAATCEALGINIHQWRGVHGSFDNFMDEMRGGSLHQILESDPDDPGRQDINFLSISLPWVSQTSPAKTPACVERLSVLGQASQQHGRMSLQAGSLNWALVATVPAMSPVRRDAAGLATFVLGLAGYKVLFVKEKGNTAGEDKLADISYGDYRWTGMVLGPGHLLIMRPGTEHVVYTLEDSIFAGGHFYSPVSLDQTFRSSLLERQYGGNSTNTQHLGAEGILHRLVRRYQQVIELKSEGASWKEMGLPDYTNMAALLAMSLFPEVFEPQTLLDSGDKDEPWERPEGLQHDRKYAREAAVWILLQQNDLVPIIQQFIDQMRAVAIAARQSKHTHLPDESDPHGSGSGSGGSELDYGSQQGGVKTRSELGSGSDGSELDSSERPTPPPDDLGPHEDGLGSALEEPSACGSPLADCELT